jgi:deazaflavin-dependent oxidoreductase (nitroreductase family)
MTGPARLRRGFLMLMWRVMNPVARRLAGVVPWWVVLETTGRRSGRPRHTPLARGPVEDGAVWLIAVHGRHATWVKNVEATPAVRIRQGRQWRAGTAALVPVDPERLRPFNRYARLGPKTVGIDPVLVRVDLEQPA